MHTLQINALPQTIVSHKLEGNVLTLITQWPDGEQDKVIITKRATDYLYHLPDYGFKNTHATLEDICWEYEMDKKLLHLFDMMPGTLHGRPVLLTIPQLVRPPRILPGKPLVLEIDWNPNNISLDNPADAEDTTIQISRILGGGFEIKSLITGKMFVRPDIDGVCEVFAGIDEIHAIIGMWANINPPVAPVIPQIVANPNATGNPTGPVSGVITRTYNGKRDFGRGYGLRIDRGNGWEEFSSWTDAKVKTGVSMGSLRALIENPTTTGKYAGWKVERC